MRRDSRRPTRPPKCNECNSSGVVGNGIRVLRSGKYWVWICQNCGHAFHQGKVDEQTKVEEVNNEDKARI